MTIQARSLPVILLGCLIAAGQAGAQTAQAPDTSPQVILEALSELPYVEVEDVERDVNVRSHLVALGAMQKEGGVWQPRASERADGSLSRYTWRVVDLYTSVQLMNDLIAQLSEALSLEPLYNCEARACGSSAQWANRIFKQRVLYGRESEQRYQVFAVDVADVSYRIMLYATARTSDRQYLHGEVLQLPLDQ
jgi:hypothetical protein